METVRRHSKKREAIWQALNNCKEHPSAEQIYAKLKPQIPDLSLGTVYRNLALFREEGNIITVATVAGQERFDAYTVPHAHFICQNCNSVIDVETPISEEAFKDIPLPGAAREFSLTFYGVCENCK